MLYVLLWYSHEILERNDKKKVMGLLVIRLCIGLTRGQWCQLVCLGQLITSENHSGGGNLNEEDASIRLTCSSQL